MGANRGSRISKFGGPAASAFQPRSSQDDGATFARQAVAILIGPSETSKTHDPRS
jgi:hypothetical protein